MRGEGEGGYFLNISPLDCGVLSVRFHLDDDDDDRLAVLAMLAE